MKKLAALALIAGATFGLSGCLIAPVMPPIGLIYTEYRAPLDIDQNESRAANLKEGRAETMSIVGLVALGDGSTSTAARNGGISTIYGADYEYFNVLGIYQRYTTVVYGE